MNRRHFVQLGGAGLASLVFVKYADAFTPVHELVHLPGKVFVKLDDGTHELHPADKHTWVYKSVTVKLYYNGNAMQVDVHSPKEALHNVQLQWAYGAHQSLVLGDHWERSYGDLSFQPPMFNRKLPWYLVQHSGADDACFGVKTGCNTICYWQVGEGARLTMDTTNGGSGVELGDRVLHCADVITTKSKPNEDTFQMAHRFCGMMCPTPRLPAKPAYGINDWYFAYGNNSYDLIIKHTSLLADLATNTNNRPFSVVDDGWNAYAPGDKDYRDDYSRANDKFKDMHKLALNINQLGMRAGLWTRPLSAMRSSNKNLWLTRNTDAQHPTLDPSIEENLDSIKRNFSIYKDWGFEMVKHDYSTFDIFGRWGMDMKNELTTPGWHLNDTSKTNAEIILGLYRSIREAAGDIYLIGCNTMSHLSAGIFELNRIGDDTSGTDWARTRNMGVNTLGFRLVQHNKFYAVDGDCVGLTTKVPWEKNKQWMELLAESSAPLFISAQPDALGEEQRAFIKQCFTKASNPQPIGEPLDWLTNQWPEKWKLDGKITEFEW
jgi:alpha-galactosidase